MSACLRDGERDPEVGDEGLSLLEENVLRLEIAMDDVMPVRVVEGAGDRCRYADRLLDGELLLAIEALSERLAFDEGHDIEQRPVRRLARVEERKEIRMLEMGSDADLGEEAFDAHDGGELRVEDLEGDLAVVLEVAREVDRRHAAGADLALDDVAIGERTNELFSQLWHGANVMRPRGAGQTLMEPRSRTSFQIWNIPNL